MTSNGFNIDLVNPAFLGRIGWRQPTLAGSPVISADNLKSDSGRYWQDFHASATIQKLKDSQEDPLISDSDFNSLLTSMDKSNLMRCLNSVFNRSQLIEHGLLYERVANALITTIPNQGNFCGYRIKVAKGDYAIQLQNLSLYFDGAATFNIYLFNDLKKAPLQTKSVTTVANDQVITPLNWTLNYNSDTNKGGLFYIGYFQDDLGSVHAMDEQLNIWDRSKVFGAYPFQSPKIGLDFNRVNPSVIFRTYGLNLEVSSYLDFTHKIIQNAQMFDEVRGLSMAISVLEVIKNSSRTNSTERQANDRLGNTTIEQDLNLAFPTQDRPFIAGLKAQVTRELKRLNDNFFPLAKAMSVDISGGSRNEYIFNDISNLPARESVR